MFSLLIPLIYYILFNGLIVLVSKKTFGKCIPLTFMISAFVYLISQFLFHTFKVGFCVNLLFPIFFIVLLIWKHKKKELDNFKNTYFTNGIIAFVVIFICVFIFDLNRTFTVWDEWSHWGVMVKEMFRLDRLYSIDASTLMVHKDYPPIVQVFEMFYCQISGGYNESFLIRSIHLFSFILFIPAISEKDKRFNIIKTCCKTILIIMGVFLLLLFFDQHGIINAIYIDYLMSILVAYLMANIIFENDITSNFNLVVYMFGFSFLLLMKQMGLPLYMMVLFMYISNIVIKNKKKLKIYIVKNYKLFIKIFITLIIIPLIFWKSWNSYASTLDMPQQFDLSDLRIWQLKGIISGSSGQAWQIETAKNYIQALKSENITTSSIHLSYLQCFILSLLLLYIIHTVEKKIFTKDQIPLSAITLSCGFIGYAFVMLVMYVFSFGPSEGPVLASYNRYMSTYVLIAMCFIYMITVYIECEQADKISKLFVIFCCLFLIQKPEMLNKCFPKIKRDYANQYESHAEIISKKVDINSKVFVISQNTLGQYQYPIKYYSGVSKTNLNNYNFLIDDKIINYPEYFNNIYKAEILKYDYLYLAVIDESFIKYYSFIFDDNPKENNIYKIILDGDNLILKNIDN